MASPNQDLQVAIVALLSGSVALTSFVGDRIFDGNPPKAAGYPRITLGPSDEVPEGFADNDCDASEVTAQIDVWSRKNGELFEARGIVDLIRKLLNGASLSLETHAAASCEVTMVRVIPDEDDMTAHGIVQVRVMLEDLS